MVTGDSVTYCTSVMVTHPWLVTEDWWQSVTSPTKFSAFNCLYWGIVMSPLINTMPLFTWIDFHQPWSFPSINHLASINLFVFPLLLYYPFRVAAVNPSWRIHHKLSNSRWGSSYLNSTRLHAHFLKSTCDIELGNKSKKKKISNRIFHRMDMQQWTSSKTSSKIKILTWEIGIS